MKPFISELRRSILQLAVEGKLVPQDPSDEPASESLEQTKSEKQRLIKERKIRKNKGLPAITKEEQTFSLPNNWALARLDEVTSYASQKKIGPKDIQDDVWLLEMEDIEPETSRIKCKIYAKNRNPQSIKNIFDSQDVIYGKLRPYLNKVIIADEPGVCTTEMIPVKFYAGHRKYLFYYLKSPQFIDKVNTLTKGINLPRLTTIDALMQLVPIPPMEEQKRIIAKVDELMRLCDELEQKSDNYLAIFSELRRTILKLATEGKLVEQDPSDEPARKLLDKIKIKKQKLLTEGKMRKSQPLLPIAEEDRPFNIPATWEWIRLKDVGITQTGKTPPTAGLKYYGGKTGFIGPGQITGDGITGYANTISKEGLEFTRTARPASTLMVCIGGTIGKSAYANEELAFNQQINSVSPASSFDDKYIYYVLNSDYFQRETLSRSSGTATPIINLNKWESLIIPLPPLEEQKRIATKIDDLMQLCNELKSQII